VLNNTHNVDPETVVGFCQEWRRFDQNAMEPEEHERLFGEYFARLPPNPTGFDAGRQRPLCSPRSADRRFMGNNVVASASLCRATLNAIALAAMARLDRPLARSAELAERFGFDPANFPLGTYRARRSAPSAPQSTRPLQYTARRENRDLVVTTPRIALFL